jgi:hypothetical protein
MKADIKNAWLEALRSGEYAQTEGELHNVDAGYCCLGVLCDVLVKRPELMPEGVSLSENEKGEFTLAFDYENGPRDDVVMATELPFVMRDLFGLTADDQSTLIHMNDEGDDDFVAIAAWIERAIAEEVP